MVPRGPDTCDSLSTVVDEALSPTLSPLVRMRSWLTANTGKGHGELRLMVPTCLHAAGAAVSGKGNIHSPQVDIEEGCEPHHLIL